MALGGAGFLKGEKTEIFKRYRGEGEKRFKILSKGRSKRKWFLFVGMFIYVTNKRILAPSCLSVYPYHRA
jgi:hypothetical protein